MFFYSFHLLSVHSLLVFVPLPRSESSEVVCLEHHHVCQLKSKGLQTCGKRLAFWFWSVWEPLHALPVPKKLLTLLTLANGQRTSRNKRLS